ncbi:hypothetical protein ACIOKD_11120 [Streptomyces sp. NPDC087844]|uniref:hypothetical protein n=1 Tax=Streptomyces sp. NPDC087844 TaxID=3365805 RepID=UPI00382310A4
MALADRSFARRRVLTTAAAVGGATLLGGTAHAADTRVTADTRVKAWPDRLPLPAGFQPEGIAIGSTPYAYFGSLADGSVYRASLATGRGSVISQGPGAGHPCVGLKTDDHGRLFVSGGVGGDLRTVDIRTGKTERTYAVGGSFVNDVILTPRAAWFTDSFAPRLYRLARDRHGRPGAVPQV